MDIRMMFQNSSSAPKKTAPVKKAEEKEKVKKEAPASKDKKGKKPAVKAILPPAIPPASEDFQFVQGRSLHADNPPFLGRIKPPVGAPACLLGITFTATGTLETLTRDELKEIIQNYGGRLTGSVSGKTDFLIRGVKEVGPSKLDAAKEKKIQIIDENGFFYILRASNPGANEDWKTLAEVLGAEEPPAPPPKAEMPIAPPVSQPILQPPPSHPDAPVEEVPSENILFTERYRPTTFEDLVGNGGAIQQLRKWLATFDKQQKKCVLISGPPGIGKTTAAVLCARAAGFDVIEFNASDTRNKKMVEQLAKDVFGCQTLVKFGQGQKRTLRNCVVFDEIDGMSSGDNGGVQALARFIETSKIPIICICNDKSGKKLECITGKLALEIPFERPDNKDMSMRIHKICQDAGITLGRSKMISIISKSNGDMRSALNAIHLWSDTVENASKKDMKENDIGKALSSLMKPEVPFDQRMDDFFVDYDMIPMYVHEHLAPTNDFDAWADALDNMALGSEMQNEIRANNSWDLLNVFGVVSSVLPVTLVPQRRQINTHPYGLGFPQILAKQSTQTKNTRYLNEFALRSTRCCRLPKDSLRDCAGDLLTLKFYTMLENGQEADLLQLLEMMELTKDDVVQLRSVVDFGLGSFPSEKVLKGTFTRMFNSSHTQSQKGESQESQRSDYYIKASTKKKGKK